MQFIRTFVATKLIIMQFKLQQTAKKSILISKGFVI